MKQLKSIVQTISFGVVLFTGACSAPRPQFDTTISSFRAAESGGRVKEALAFYESQAQQAEKQASANPSAKQFWEAATVNYNYASRAARASGDLQKSIDYAAKGLQTAEKSEEPFPKLDAIHQLVIAYRDLRKFETAEEYLRRGAEILQQLRVNNAARNMYEGLFQNHWGRVFERKREYANAANAYLEAIKWHRSRMSKLDANDPQTINARLQVISNLSNLGSAYRRAGQLDLARETFSQAFDSLNQWRLGYPYEYRLYAGLGEVYRQDKQLPKALENFQKALALAAAQRAPDGVLTASTGVGRILHQIGKNREALPYLRQAVDQVESIRSRLESADDRQTFFERGADVYIETIRTYVSLKEWAEAFNFSERARSRAFLDVMGTKAQLAKATSGLLAEERTLNERIAALKSSVILGSDEVERASLTRELQEAENAYGDFLVKLSKENKEQVSLMSVSPLTVEQVQGLLDPEVSLISYLVTGDFVRIWIVENKRLRYVQVRFAKKDLGDSVRQLREVISSPNEKESFTKVSTALYKRLVEPILPYVTGKALIIVPHDVLHYLPFHALVGPDGRHLIEKYPISYLSSASLMQFTKEKRTARAKNVLAFGNPDLGDRSRDLDYAELEAQEVQSAYPDARLYVRREATEERAKALSPQNDIIHFASHAELNEDDPLSSAVLLVKSGKEDGRLEVREIFGMNLKANLVVLSACDTGLGKLSTGDELVGLTRAFIYAGTPSVIASLWQVDDVATAGLMSRFYMNLKTMSKVEALRQAQLELIKGQGSSDILARRGNSEIEKRRETPSTNPPAPSKGIVATNGEIQMPVTVSTAHPYFWAPFILVGEGQ